MGRLSGKIVLITGASAGIGAASAFQFAAEGAHLILLARRLDRLEELSERIRKQFPSVRVFVESLDVLDREAVDTLPSRLPDDFKPVDVLLLNAGLARGYYKAWENPMSELDLVVDTNVKAVAQFVRLFVPEMRTRGSGHIITIASIAGQETYAGGSVYCASKHAVRAYMQCLQKELVNTPVNVTMVSPGLVSTEFFLQRLDGNADAAAKVLEGDVALLADDIADAVVWAASRPGRVNVGEITITSTRQAGVGAIHRGPFEHEAASAASGSGSK